MAATGGGVLAGGVLTSIMTWYGLRRVDTQPSLFAVGASLALGAVAGVAAVVSAHRAGEWTVLPELIVWAGALVAAAVCDAVTQRVPTGLVRLSVSGVALLLVVGLSLRGDWKALSVTVIAVLASTTILLACWRFAGAGFADVRLAVLGGLGLGHATALGLVFGFSVFAVVVTTQVVKVLAGGGGRQTHVPLGPALAAGFIVAAAG